MRKWRVAALFSGLLVLYCLSISHTNFASNDVKSAAVGSWRIATTGAPWLDGVDLKPMTYRAPLWVGPGADGHLVSFRSPGAIAGGLPGYFVAHLLGADGWSMIPGGICASVLTVLALWLLYLALRPRIGNTLGLLAVGTLGLTTPIWSVSADAMWTHPVTFLGLAGMAYGCVRERWWLVGLFGGVALWGRLHTVVIIAILGLALAWTRRSPRIAVEVGAVSLAFVGLSTLWTHWMYGNWSPAGGYSVAGYADRVSGSTGSLTDQLVNQLGLWISPDRGILVWTPLLILLLPALVRSWRDLPDWSRWLLLGGLAYTFLQGQINGFSGGSGFYGYRLTLELLVCAAPAYSFSVGRMGRWAQELIGPVVGLQFGAFALGAVGQGGIFNEHHLWTNNAYVFALTSIPVLFIWLLLTVFIGGAIARVLRDRLSSEGPVQVLVP